MARTPTELRLSAGTVHHLGGLSTALRDVLSTLDDRRGEQPPVILGPGGHPWTRANDWLHEGLDGAAEATREAYARDLAAFGCWCVDQGLDPHAVAHGDLRDYQEDRLGEDGIGPGTWNRNLAAIGGFLTWLEDRGERPRRADPPPSALRIDVDAAPAVEVIDPADYTEFRQIGLLREHELGDGDDGVPTRDALFADLLLTTGLRRAEAAALLLPELLAAEADPDHTLPVAAALRPAAGRGRTSVDGGFVAAHARFRARWWPSTATRDPAADVEVADDLRDGAVRLDGRWCELDELPAERRLRVVAEPGLAARLGLPVVRGALVPLGLFPSSRSRCPEPSTWTAVFREARARVADHRRDRGRPQPPRISPRTLRQTSAVRFLEGPVGDHLGHRTSATPVTLSELEWAVRPELQALQLRLGHATPEATRRYLEVAVARHGTTLATEDEVPRGA